MAVDTGITAEDVREIFEGEVAPITTGALEAHIDAASEIVGDIRAADPSVANSRLRNIHKYLSAHIATTQAPKKSKEGEESYSLSWLRESDYGQVAMQLDPSGAISDTQEVNSSIRTGSIRGSGYRR